jgi:hypothetical protein
MVEWIGIRYVMCINDNQSMSESDPVLLDVWVRRQDEGDPPFPPVAHVVPKIHSRVDDRLTIGPNMMSEREVDELFDILERNLERARAKAKEELQKE